tara:strand:- start:452 stop:586 length:135 start_codon:yes stop_codon:yes gene_type:complete
MFVEINEEEDVTRNDVRGEIILGDIFEIDFTENKKIKNYCLNKK